MNKRVDYIISLYQKLRPEEEITKTTKINNATIESICAYDGPAYYRVKNWLEAKIGEKRQKEIKGELNTNEDIRKFYEVLKECYDLAKDRMQSYGNSWKIMDIESIAKLMMMKLDRIAELGEDNAKTKDELEDCINYATFALIKYNEKNK